MKEMKIQINQTHLPSDVTESSSLTVFSFPTNCPFAIIVPASTKKWPDPPRAFFHSLCSFKTSSLSWKQIRPSPLHQGWSALFTMCCTCTSVAINWSERSVRNKYSWIIFCVYNIAYNLGFGNYLMDEGGCARPYRMVPYIYHASSFHSSAFQGHNSQRKWHFLWAPWISNVFSYFEIFLLLCVLLYGRYCFCFCSNEK